MRIDFDVLRKRGWKVQVDANEVVIYGDQLCKFGRQTVDELVAVGLSVRDAEQLMDEIAAKAEMRLIMRDCE